MFPKCDLTDLSKKKGRKRDAVVRGGECSNSLQLSFFHRKSNGIKTSSVTFAHDLICALTGAVTSLPFQWFLEPFGLCTLQSTHTSKSSQVCFRHVLLVLFLQPPDVRLYRKFGVLRETSCKPAPLSWSLEDKKKQNERRGLELHQKATASLETWSDSSKARPTRTQMLCRATAQQESSKELFSVIVKNASFKTRGISNIRGSHCVASWKTLSCTRRTSHFQTIQENPPLKTRSPSPPKETIALHKNPGTSQRNASKPETVFAQERKDWRCLEKRAPF